MDRFQEEHAAAILADILAPLLPCINDEDVQEIMVNRPRDVWIEKKGEQVRLDVPLDEVAIRTAITVLGRLDNKDVAPNSKNAIVDTRFGHYRVAAVVAPTAVHGHAICIRKQAHVDTVLDDYVADSLHGAGVRQDAMSVDRAELARGGPVLADFLRWVVRARKNVIVSGGTSSGKTTFMKALLWELDPRDRVLVIEDTPEIQVSVPNKVHLQTNEQAGITTRDLVRLALRFRPDRIIVGEVRGAEAFDLLQAMNTGHDGGFTSVHANSPRAALAKLETLVLTANVDWPHKAIQSQIGSTVDYVVQMARVRERRVISAIMEVQGYRDGDYVTSTLYERE